jgi:hypothetical protein
MIRTLDKVLTTGMLEPIGYEHTGYDKIPHIAAAANALTGMIHSDTFSIYIWCLCRLIYQAICIIHNWHAVCIRIPCAVYTYITMKKIHSAYTECTSHSYLLCIDHS